MDTTSGYPTRTRYDGSMYETKKVLTVSVFLALILSPAYKALIG